MSIPPDVPTELPVASVVCPDTPAVPELAVARFKLPLDDEVLRPVVNSIEPPVEVEDAPPSADTFPPIPPFPDPGVSKMSPPLPDTPVPLPPEMEI